MRVKFGRNIMMNNYKLNIVLTLPTRTEMGIRTRHFMVRIQEYLNSGSETDGSCPLSKINRKDLKNSRNE
jgi:hypothetical protein